MNGKTKKIFGVFIKIFCILLGTFILGCAYNLFYAPNDIVLGGFGGLSMLISGWLETVNLYIDMNIIYFALNILIFIFAVKLLGKSFAFYTLIGITSYTVFLSLTEFVSTITIPNDLLLCCLYGGVLMGVGVGIVVRVGSSTGGADLLGCIANHFSRKMTVGNVSMVINFIVVILSVLTYGIELSLYSIISIYISGIITDLVVEGPKTVKAYYIISKNYVEISDAIMNKLGRGVTALHAEGMYTRNDQRVLLCIVYKHQIGSLKNIIYSIDNKAFVYSVSVNDAMGKGFSTLSPSQSILQRLTLKNKIKAVPAQNLQNDINLSPLPTTDGVNVFEENFKEDLIVSRDANAVNESTQKQVVEKKAKTNQTKKSNSKSKTCKSSETKTTKSTSNKSNATTKQK
ncbi:MAG: YitT family protein [Clostridia bacterium]|nr:YitT family protein [Clostridia bacterium]